jgi:AAA domain (dynein-related subfamily)
MGSYVVKTNDIREVVKHMEALKGSAGTFDFKEDLLNHLTDDEEYRRIKWFFYCDDVRGNTIRLLDRHFLENFAGSLSGTDKPLLLLRGESLGKAGESPKTEMLGLFVDVKRKGEYPGDVTWEGGAKAFDYFEQLNGNHKGVEGDVMAVEATEQLNEGLARYQPLVDKTFMKPEFFKCLEMLLKDHKQVILEGPPGSGKTYVAENFAKWWTNPCESGATAGSTWKLVQFHESYGYEDFFQGIRPQLLDAEGNTIKPSDTRTPVDKMVYRNCPGVFHAFCDDARHAKDAPPFVLVIDEINRGKASRIFGELLYLLEYRDEKIQLASGEMFEVPKSVYLVGTMNTADRSIALVDYALRRRFKFVGLRPYEKEGGPSSDGNAPVLRKWLQAKSISNVEHVVKLFCKLNEKTSKINPHFVVGHSYFMAPRVKDRARDSVPDSFSDELLQEIWEFSILPLLSEYEPHRSLEELKDEYGLDALRRSIQASE